MGTEKRLNNFTTHSEDITPTTIVLFLHGKKPKTLFGNTLAIPQENVIPPSFFKHLFITNLLYALFSTVK